MNQRFNYHKTQGTSQMEDQLQKVQDKIAQLKREKAELEQKIADKRTKENEDLKEGNPNAYKCKMLKDHGLDRVMIVDGKLSTLCKALTVDANFVPSSEQFKGYNPWEVRNINAFLKSGNSRCLCWE